MPSRQFAVLFATVAAALGGCANSQSTPDAPGYGFVGGPTPRPAPAGNAASASEAVAAPDYVVEFRARPGPDIIGHSYLVYGIEGPDGEIVDPVQVGLYPKSMSGFAVGVGGLAEATTEPVAYDTTIPPNAVYRHAITPEQHARLDAAVAAARADPPAWNWTLYNCNTFVAHMATVTGLKTPYGATLLAPAALVTRLEMLNGEA